MRISDWSSDVCSSDLAAAVALGQGHALWPAAGAHAEFAEIVSFDGAASLAVAAAGHGHHAGLAGLAQFHRLAIAAGWHGEWAAVPALIMASRSEEHTSELQSLMRTSYAVFCLKKKKSIHQNTHRTTM